MDVSIQRALTDKLYDKRKQGALDLEKLIRDSLAAQDYERIGKIVNQLCHDFAYAVHQPHARNGGLIGLAAASIALGTEDVAQYLKDIVPPVLACFTDQDARVRYYACESMYNIAKVAKGEILLFFNDVFDSLCKLAADAELSVKNGAELLDRLIKDIVSESAATYVSVLTVNADTYKKQESAVIESTEPSLDLTPAFSLEKFIPLLQERIYVLNPFTRTFLVSWVTLLDSIPDLELVMYLPAFLGGLFKFLSDPNRDVYVATQGALDRFLNEIRKIAKIKQGIAESKRGGKGHRLKDSSGSEVESLATDPPSDDDDHDDQKSHSLDGPTDDEEYHPTEDDWIPGQDVHVDHPRILSILVDFLDPASASEEEIRLTSLRWLLSFFDISPEDILPFVPRLLSQVLPAMASEEEKVRAAANRVNNALMEYIASFPDESDQIDQQPGTLQRTLTRELEIRSRPASAAKTRLEQNPEQGPGFRRAEDARSPAPPSLANSEIGRPVSDVDYDSAIATLTLHFLNEHEATRIAALAWLIMLHRKAPSKVLATNEGTFPALLKTLSDPSDLVIMRDLQLLSQISRNSGDSYFTSFMGSLLQLFCTDRSLLEKRGNLIIRQLCINLSPERIYRTLAENLEKDEDVEFASIMVQNLNNNLITAPELSDLRKRLRNLDTKDGQSFFVTLFRTWCHNAVATFSLCLLAQAYEQAYNLLQVFADLEMTVNMLIQIDKLVQLLESPVFTYLRLQLLEPDRYPYLYKCLYGVLMLLPQSSAFAALKNRLNSVSAIGYLQMPSRVSIPPTPTATYDRPNRLKSRDEGSIRWTELVERFKGIQDKAQRPKGNLSQEIERASTPADMLDLVRSKNMPDIPKVVRPSSAELPIPRAVVPMHKPKSSLSQFSSRLARGVGQKSKK